MTGGNIMMKHNRKGKRVSIGACNSKRRAMQGTTRNRFAGSVTVIVRVYPGILFAIDALSRHVIWLPRIIRCDMRRVARRLSRFNDQWIWSAWKIGRFVKRSRKTIPFVEWIITDWANLCLSASVSHSSCAVRISLIHTLIAFPNRSQSRSEKFNTEIRN